MEKAAAAVLAGLIVFGVGRKGAKSSDEAISFRVKTRPLAHHGSWLLPAEEVVRRAGATVKVLPREKLAVVCRADRCASLPLDGEHARMVDGALFLAQTALGRALDATVRYAPGSGRVTIQYVRASQAKEEAFTMKIGQQVPDIEFTDLEGKPVHLSDFRGKRLAVFSWASW